MAYFMIKASGKYYMNVDLFSFVEKKNIVNVLCDVASGEQAFSTMFGQVLFPVSTLRAKGILTSLGLQECNIDAQLSELRESSPDDEIKETIIEAKKHIYSDIEFVKFTDILLRDKYNKRERMATVRVGASLYVALDFAPKKAINNALVISEA